MIFIKATLIKLRHELYFLKCYSTTIYLQGITSLVYILDKDVSLQKGPRYIELKLSIPMAEIISTVMTYKYNRGTNYHTSLQNKERAIFCRKVEVEDITTRVFSFTIDYNVNSA